MKYQVQIWLGAAIACACAAEPGKVKAHPADGARLRLSIERFDGRSGGAGNRKDLEVFTERPQLLGGATFVLLAPEHPMLRELTSPVLWSKVKAYVEEANKKPLARRADSAHKASGVFLGSYAVNPLSGWRIPLWVSDSVSGNDPFQACLGVPAHESWQLGFAREHGIDVVPVIRLETENGARTGKALRKAYTGAGTLIDSGELTGTKVTNAKGVRNPGFAAAVKWLKDHGRGDTIEGTSNRAWALAQRTAATTKEQEASKALPGEKNRERTNGATKPALSPAAPAGKLPEKRGEDGKKGVAPRDATTGPVMAGKGAPRVMLHRLEHPLSRNKPKLNRMTDHSWILSKPRLRMGRTPSSCS